MSKLGHPLVTLAIILVGALLAALIMLQLSSGSSLLAFIGWTVFFVTLQLPWLWVSRAGNCMAWLSGNRTK
jgi:hypothetical protein